MKVLLVGGLGRLESVYRAAAESAGHELVYVENHRGRLPMANHRGYDLLLVMVAEVAHGLRDQAELIAKQCSIPIRYLRSSSLSEMRRQLEGVQHAAA